ncbi:MAG: long-chain-acyl-CoA synthetase, partial [Asticcacaulis sp.]|nr:long-chain-acyl-CoA synthetase [Asticcacaulis sp.]
MGFFTSINRDITFVKRLMRILNAIGSVSPDSPNLVCDDFEKACDRYKDNLAVLFEGKTLTYQQLDTLAN